MTDGSTMVRLSGLARCPPGRARGAEVLLDQGGGLAQRDEKVPSHLLGGAPAGVGGQVDRGGDPAVRVADRSGEGAQALLELLVDEGVAVLADAYQFAAE